MNFCPCQYFHCIEKTFLDSAIFARSSETPSDPLNITMQHLKHQFAQAYPWAMGKGKSLPAAYILPKGKKQYGSGRPIIGFFNAPFKPMLSTLAKLISIGSTSMSRTLRTRRCLPIVETFARKWHYDGRQGFANLQPRSFWVFHQH